MSKRSRTRRMSMSGQAMTIGGLFMFIGIMSTTLDPLPWGAYFLFPVPFLMGLGLHLLNRYAPAKKTSSTEGSIPGRLARRRASAVALIITGTLGLLAMLQFGTTQGAEMIIAAWFVFGALTGVAMLFVSRHQIHQFRVG